jgi:choline transporter-like protein 2/4/5
VNDLTNLTGNDSPDGKNAAKDAVEKDLEKGLHRFGTFLAVRQFGERVFSDLKATYWMVGIALLGACVISFVWILLMRFLAGAMVYTSILTVFLGVGSLLGYCSYNLYNIWPSDDPETNKNIFQLNWTPEIIDDFLKQKNTWLAFTSVVGILFLVVVCLFIFLWQRIRIAIALIEQGSKAVGQSISSLFFPLLPFVLQLVVVAWFLIVALYLSSWGIPEHRIAFNDRSSNEIANNGTWIMKDLPDHCSDACAVTELVDNKTVMRTSKEGEDCVPEKFNQTCGPACPEISCQFVKYGPNKDYSWMQMINVFGLYWGLFFFTAFGELVLAGVFAEWYWSNDKSYMPSCVLGSAIWNATVFHLGTIAFGSLIIAIIRMIRTILEYVEKKCKKFNNDLTKCLLKCCQCCLWCLEKFMRFINRNAYIMCAVKSTNFCSSAKSAFNLLMRNLFRVVVLDSVVDFLLFLGKIVIVLLTGAVSYLAFAGHMPDIKDQIPSLNYIYTPVVFIVIGSYCIASSFFGVYNMAVDTLFLCFLEDLERNDGSAERPYSMSISLQKILGKMNEIASESRSRSRMH